MSAIHVSARTRTRLVPVLVGALVTALAVFGLSPVPAANAADPVLSFVGATSNAGNRTAHSVTLPAVAAGDTMVLFISTNSTTALTAPAGWTLLQSQTGTSTSGRAWTKQAVAGDAGSTVTVSSGTTTLKDAMSVAAYRSTGGTPSVTASASSPGTAGTSFTTPSVAVAQAGSWLVNSWSEKSSTASTWTKPATSTTRATPAATGGGKVSSLLADSNAPVPTGTAAGRTATSSVTGGAAPLFSVVVSPGTGTVTPPPTNVAPVASFTATCSGLTCNFNASASSDANNDPLTYAWQFGDGSTGAGVTTAKTYATAAARTVTLTVSDGTNSAQTTRTATPSDGTAAATLSFIAAGNSQGNRTSHAVQIPAAVQAGDTLVMFLSTNSISGTIANPAGWTLLKARTAPPPEAGLDEAGFVDRRRLQRDGDQRHDQGHDDRRRLPQQRGSASVTASARPPAPPRDQPRPPRWRSPRRLLLVNPGARVLDHPDLDQPATSTTRANPASTGSGKVSSLMADSNGAVATGTAASRTATTTRRRRRTAVLRGRQPRQRGCDPPTNVAPCLVHRGVPS